MYLNKTISYTNEELKEILNLKVMLLIQNILSKLMEYRMEFDQCQDWEDESVEVIL
jgi:hypothetical protein